MAKNLVQMSINGVLYDIRDQRMATKLDYIHASLTQALEHKQDLATAVVTDNDSVNWIGRLTSGSTSAVTRYKDDYIETITGPADTHIHSLWFSMGPISYDPADKDNKELEQQRAWSKSFGVEFQELTKRPRILGLDAEDRKAEVNIYGKSLHTEYIDSPLGINYIHPDKVEAIEHNIIGLPQSIPELECLQWLYYGKRDNETNTTPLLENINIIGNASAITNIALWDFFQKEDNNYYRVLSEERIANKQIDKNLATQNAYKIVTLDENGIIPDIFLGELKSNPLNIGNVQLIDNTGKFIIKNDNVTGDNFVIAIQPSDTDTDTTKLTQTTINTKDITASNITANNITVSDTTETKVLQVNENASVKGKVSANSAEITNELSAGSISTEGTVSAKNAIIANLTTSTPVSSAKAVGYDDTGKLIPIAYSDATQSSAGLMSAADKKKLDDLNVTGKSAKSSFLDEYPGAGSTRLTSGNIIPKDSSEYGGMRKDVVTSSMTDSGRPNKDGHLLTMFWDNTGRFDSQFFVSNEKQPVLKVRGKGNETDYGAWSDIITSNNIGSQSVAKAGTADTASTAGTADKATRLKPFASWQQQYVYDETNDVRVNVYKITMASYFNSILVQIYDDINYAKCRRYVLGLWHAANHGYNVSVTDLGGTKVNGLKVWMGTDGNVYLQADVYWISRITFSYLDDPTNVTVERIGNAKYGSNKDIDGNVLFTPLTDPITDCGAIRAASDLSSALKVTQNLKADVFTGNLTGDVTGNVTGNLTGDVTGNVTGNVSGSSGSAGKLTTARTAYVDLGTASTTRTIDWSGDTTIPVDGVLGVANGGTGASTAEAAANSLIASLPSSQNVPVDSDYFISQVVNGGPFVPGYERRPVSKLWEYIKGKISQEGEKFAYDHIVYDDASLLEWANCTDGSMKKVLIKSGMYNITKSVDFSKAGTGYVLAEQGALIKSHVPIAFTASSGKTVVYNLSVVCDEDTSCAFSSADVLNLTLYNCSASYSIYTEIVNKSLFTSCTCYNCSYVSRNSVDNTVISMKVFYQCRCYNCKCKQTISADSSLGISFYSESYFYKECHCVSCTAELTTRGSLKASTSAFACYYECHDGCVGCLAIINVNGNDLIISANLYGFLRCQYMSSCKETHPEVYAYIKGVAHCDYISSTYGIHGESNTHVGNSCSIQ